MLVDMMLLSPLLLQAAALKLGLSYATTPLDLLGLRYSREHETEADQVGLLLAARACYDPYHAQYLSHEFARERQLGAAHRRAPQPLLPPPTPRPVALFRLALTRGLAPTSARPQPQPRSPIPAPAPTCCNPTSAGKMPGEDFEVLSTHPLDGTREAAMREQVGKGMAERRRCSCCPVDMNQRVRLDRQLKTEPIRGLSCCERGEIAVARPRKL